MGLASSMRTARKPTVLECATAPLPRISPYGEHEMTKRVKEYLALWDRLSEIEVKLDELWEDMTAKEKKEVDTTK